MPTRLDKIIELIKEEADTVNNPDPISRLYNVEMQIQTRVINEIYEILKEQRNADKD